MNLFDWTLKIRGYDIAFAKARLSKIQSIPDVDYAEYIAQKKAAIVAYHQKNTPFYNDFLQNVSLSDWNNIPILTKADLQQPLEKRISKEYRKKSYYTGKTSGSSGHPFVFAKDKETHALTWAVIQNRFGWYDIDFNRSLQARFYGIPLDPLNYQKELSLIHI